MPVQAASAVVAGIGHSFGTASTGTGLDTRNPASKREQSTWNSVHARSRLCAIIGKAQWN